MWRKIYGTRRAQSLSHAFVDVRMMKPPRIWAMETRNGFILEGKSPEPWRHWYPTSHSPATYLTHKLTSFKAIEIDMGLCQKLDTIPASVDENNETLNNFYTSLGPALPIATLQWKIIIYKTSIIMAVNC